MMRSRCNYPKASNYKYYGGKGVRVCGRWNNFQLFLEDMGEKPTPYHTLDRINPDGDYEPNNCRWATKSEQVRHRRIFLNNKSGYTGVSFIKRVGKFQATIYAGGNNINLGVFSDIKDAISARKRGELIYGF